MLCMKAQSFSTHTKLAKLRRFSKTFLQITTQYSKSKILKTGTKHLPRKNSKVINLAGVPGKSASVYEESLNALRFFVSTMSYESASFRYTRYRRTETSPDVMSAFSVMGDVFTVS